MAANPRTGKMGFTLVELLVSLIIVSILAALTLSGLATVRRRAKEDATRNTIRKIHEIIMPMYESYLDRRVPATGAVRLANIRKLLAREMPDVRADVLASPAAVSALTDDFLKTGTVRAYASYRAAVTTWTDQYQTAECLYMIITRSGFRPDAMEQFRAEEIGDADGDGVPEFHDAWGVPIGFLRWAPGFVTDPSPVDANVAAAILNPRSLLPRIFSPLQFADTANNHDPFDFQGDDSNAYQLTPLIYSAGIDQEDGLRVQVSGWASGSLASICTRDADPSDVLIQLAGEPSTLTSAAVSTAHLDNITNHDLVTR